MDMSKFKDQHLIFPSITESNRTGINEVPTNYSFYLF